MNQPVSRKRRVLFVDDEPLVLQGLRRMLRGMRDEWEMDFVESGARALEMMQERPFDVVVSDMRMPGMNGAQLLNTLAQRHPDTIRIILSGHADQALITQCLGSAHQYLSKPCDPDLLKRLVNAACQLGQEVPSERVRRVVGGIGSLPSLPLTYQRLTEAIAREDTTAVELGRIVAEDIAMTAKVLKLVNSAFFGLRRELADPTEAVTYLGTETIKSLVLANGVFEEGAPLETRGIQLDEIWRHSMAVAANARALLRALGGDEQEQNCAFTAGLLHDAGILVLARHFPEAYDEVTDLVATQQYFLPLAEQRVLGVNHAEVGAYLFGLWGLPSEVVQAVHYHHNPSEFPQGLMQPSAVAVVHLADGLYGKRAASPAFEHAALDPALLQAPWLAGRLDELQACLLP